MRYIKVFAPGTVANLGCGFDVMGLTLDGVGDLLEVGIEEGAGARYPQPQREGTSRQKRNNVITPAVMALLGAYEKPVRVEVTILEKIAPGSGIGSSAASSAAAVWGVNELLGRPFSGERLVEFAMMGEALIGGTSHADNVGPAVLGGVVLIRGTNRWTSCACLSPRAFSMPWCIPTSWSVPSRRAKCFPARYPARCRDAVGQCRRAGGRVRPGRRGADRSVDARRGGGALPQGVHSGLRCAEGRGARRRRPGDEHCRVGAFDLRPGRR